MIEVIGLLLATFAAVLRSRKHLILENLLLREQLQVALSLPAPASRPPL